jgi:aminoglycoside phosphotransferase (APT) family kinase protein
MSSDRRFFEEVCQRFGLGTIAATPVAVEGGLSNRLSRVTTNRGDYAVKRMVANADSPSFKRNVEASFAVERLAYAAGIAMPEPIPVSSSGEALGRILDRGDLCWVRVHRWVSARRVAAEDIEPGDVAQLGGILAALHRLPFASPESPSRRPPAPERDWRAALSSHAAAPALFDAIVALENIVRPGYEAPRPGRVVSHRDLDAKNVLRDEHGTLIVIDWDAAGPIDPQWDVIGVAMDWSGVWHGAVSPEAFEAVLEAYANAGGTLEPVTPASFTGWAEGTLDWLWFNLERSASPDPGERLRGQAEVEATVRFLPTAAVWIANQP